jgi:hypothetical protein
VAAATLSALALLACRSPAPGPGEAECPVCRHEGDLACLCVRIEPDTPSLSLEGVPYYFCSDECRTRFARDPRRFLAR